MATKPAAIPGGSTFDLDKTVTFGDSSLTAEVTGTSDSDVVDAILNNKPFPDRADGKIALGHVGLKAETGKSFSFGSAGTGSVTFGGSAGFETGIGVFDASSDAVDSLELDDAPELEISIPDQKDNKFLVMMWGYNLGLTVQGSHPIGALGTLTFGADGARDAKYAVIHRFPGKATGAFTAIDDTIKSWRLPRQIAKPGDLKPGTWLLAEVDGSIAINLAAQLGYDFNMFHETQLLGMTRNLGAKIDAGLKVTFGLDVSGRYLVVLGRECQKEGTAKSGVVRLQLFKQSKRGLNFGLNLSLGVTGPSDIPNADDLVRAVFGIHGAQVLKDLQILRDWTGPDVDLGKNVASLLNDDGLKLLTSATGIDARAKFNQARQLVLDEFDKWDALPDRVAAATWRIMGKATGDAATKDFQAFLTALADPDPDTRAQGFADALQSAVFGDDPKGQWLSALADHGLLALSSQLDTIQPIAAKTLDILNGGIIRKVQDFINQKLDLTAIRNAVTQNDFDTLDGWLVARLGAFFDKDLHFADLKPVQAAINTVFTKVDEIQSKVQQAVSNRYSLDVAATYARNTTDTALLDANFDLNQKDAAAMFQKVMASSQLDSLLTRRVTGVTVNSATLSHEIQRTTTVQINMPYFTFDSTHMNDSLALVSKVHGGNITVQLKASDLDMVKNRFRSELSVLCNLRMRNGKLQMAPSESQTIAYELREARAKMSLVDFEHQVTPFINSYLPKLFAGDGNKLTTFYTDLDRTAENVLHNGTNEFGDVATSMQVSAPAQVLSAWFIRRDPARLRRDKIELSKALQMSFRRLLPAYYLQEDSKLASNFTIAALLVWAAMPIATTIEIDNISGDLKFGNDGDVFWNWPSDPLRHAVATDKHTTALLVPTLLALQKRLQEAGDSDQQFFNASSASSWQHTSISSAGDELLRGLLFTEAQIIRGATKALEEINNFTPEVKTAPSQAIKTFANFGADLTEAFHHNLSSVYGDESLRVLSSVVLVEASRAIAPELTVADPSAMLTILTLANHHTFDLSSFLDGEMPAKTDVALAQTLVS